MLHFHSADKYGLATPIHNTRLYSAEICANKRFHQLTLIKIISQTATVLVHFLFVVRILVSVRSGEVDRFSYPNAIGISSIIWLPVLACRKCILASKAQRTFLSSVVFCAAIDPAVSVRIYFFIKNTSSVTRHCFYYSSHRNQAIKIYLHRLPVN